MRNFPGSPSISSNFLRITAEQFLLSGVFASSKSFSLLERRDLSIFWSVKVSSTRSSSFGLMNRGGIGMEGPSTTRPLQVVMDFSSPFGLTMVLLESGPEPEVEAVFIWKKLASMFLSSLVWLDIEA
uniref:Uncharacterized protein n=1 Tax=Tanacetum cinerariifolium TaxID=118510 RepID=A0A699TZE2_TANCI|nr:hypothetical protein [Tanacetum cinerariifolium]